jgi:hypothetical protein
VLEVLRGDIEKRGAKTIEDLGMRNAVFIECIAKPSGVEPN